MQSHSRCAPFADLRALSPAAGYGILAACQPKRDTPMLHAILCYNHEDTVWSWTAEQEAKVMASLGVVQERLVKEGKLGPSARLLPTKHAKTLRKDREPAWVVDGPFAETKEQLLGFYVVDCADM